MLSIAETVISLNLCFPQSDFWWSITVILVPKRTKSLLSFFSKLPDQQELPFRYIFRSASESKSLINFKSHLTRGASQSLNSVAVIRLVEDIRSD